MSEEEFNLLSDYIDALIEKKIGDAFGRDTLTETLRANALKQDAINVICFGETLEEGGEDIGRGRRRHH